MALCSRLVQIVAVTLFTMPSQSYAGPARRGPGVLQHKNEQNDAEQEENMIEKDRDLHGVVLKLNDRIFDGNVLKQSDYSTEHWMVYWCPNWFEPCTALMEKYAPLSTQWQGKLNKDSLLRMNVRFAKVDCATDKPLCNKMGVEDYPTVQHYHKGVLVRTFVGRVQKPGSKLEAWLKQELDNIEQYNEKKVSSLTPGALQFIVPAERSLDIFLVVLLISINFWVVARNPNLRQKAGYTGESAPTSPAVNAQAACSSAMVDQPSTSNDEAPTEAMTGMESLMPQEWLRQRNSMEL